MKQNDILAKPEILIGSILRAMRTGWCTFKIEGGVTVEMRLSPTKTLGEVRIETCPLALLGRHSDRGKKKRQHYVWWKDEKKRAELVEIIWNHLRLQPRFLECWLETYFQCTI